MFKYSYVSIQAAGREPAEVELLGDSLVGGLPAAQICPAFPLAYDHSHISSHTVK